MVPSYCFSLSPFLFSFSASLPLFPYLFLFLFFLLLLGVPSPLPFSSSCSTSFLLFLPRFPSSSSSRLLLRITCQLDLSHFCDIQPSHKQDELSAGSFLVWECSCGRRVGNVQRVHAPSFWPCPPALQCSCPSRRTCTHTNTPWVLNGTIPRALHVSHVSVSVSTDT